MVDLQGDCGGLRLGKHRPSRSVEGTTLAIMAPTPDAIKARHSVVVTGGGRAVAYAGLRLKARDRLDQSVEPDDGDICRYRRIYLSLTMLRDQGLHTSLKQDLSHGSEPGKPHSRARLRDLDLAWLRTWSGRSALACGRAGNLDGIDGRAPRQARPTKEAPVACTFKDHQDPRAGQLMPQMPPRVTG